MAKQPTRKKRGAVSSTGKVGLRFNEGSPQDTSSDVKKVRTKRLKDKKKTIPGNVQERQTNETISQYFNRRDDYRAEQKAKRESKKK